MLIQIVFMFFIFFKRIETAKKDFKDYLIDTHEKKEVHKTKMQKTNSFERESIENKAFNDLSIN